MNHPFIFRKRFGQHFLIDKAMIEHIVSFVDPKPVDNIVEIGPGIGALTLPLLKKSGKMSAIELDINLIPMLEEACREAGEISIYAEDALAFNFLKLAKPGQSMRVVGNLPYNVSTPLLFHLLHYVDHIQDMHFMLQKEVVDRLAAQPGSSIYGRLSVMVQYQCKVTSLLLVPPSAFLPPPKVESKIVRLVPYTTPPYIVLDFELFENVVRRVFGMRRKTLKNALKNWVNPKIWEIVGIENKLRPEVLSVKDYVELCNAISRYSCS